MELYCSELESFVELASGEFSIQAESQLQNLTDYTVLNSFDIEIMNNSDSRRIVKNQLTVLLINNGVPIFQGRIIQIGMSSPDVIKCVYQALPALGCFKEFKMKDKIKDYFCPTMNDNTIISPVDIYGSHDTRGVQNVPKYRRMKLTNIEDESRFCTGYMLNWQNRLNYCWTNFADVVMDSDEKSKAHDFPTNRYYNNGTVSYCERGFMYVPLYSLLWAMGLKVPSDYQQDMPSQGGILVNTRFNSHYMLKICMASVLTFDTDNTKTINYTIEPTTDIYIQPTESGEWDDSKPYYLLPQKYFYNNLRRKWDSHNKLDRESKAPFDMTVKRVDYYYRQETTGYIEPELAREEVEYKDKKWWVYREDLEEGITWSKGDRTYINIGYTSNIGRWKDTPQGDRLVSYACAYADCEFDLDYVKYIATWKDQTWDYVPLLLNQMQWLDTDINTFFAEVSLNSQKFKILRNPMFITKDNRSFVHGTIDIPLYTIEKFRMTDENVISASIEYDEEANSKLEVGFDNGVYGLTKTKQLNDLDTESNEIRQVFVSVPFKLKSDIVHPIPPFYYHWTTTTLDDDHCSETEYGSNSIKGFICSVHNNCTVNESNYDLEYSNSYGTKKEKVPYDNNMRPITPDCSEYDYMDRYVSHYEKWTVQCVGYKFQEQVEWNGQLYEVGTYKTSDMVVFTLTLYPVK